MAMVQFPVAPEARAAGPRTVDVSIDALTPTVPKKDDTLTVSGTLTNRSDAPVTDAHVGLRRGQALTSRSAIDTAAKRTGFSSGADGEEIKDRTQKIDKLAPGVSRTFTLQVPVKDLGLGDDGVYQLGVSLSGRSGDSSYEQVLGAQRTFLPWQTSDVAKKSQLTYLWPLISSTHLTAETDADAEQTPVFRNDNLAAEIAPGGRLQQLVALGKDLPVTFVIDPDVLASVDAMTKTYKVEGPNGPTAGKNQAVAKQWLAQVEEAVKTHEVVALPFADPDLASLAHRGKEVPSALGHLGPATTLAATTVETILGVKPRTDFAWPAEGAVDSSIVDVATSGGAHNIIARSDSLQENDLSYSPTAARPIGGGNTAIVSDARLSTAFEGDLSKAENSTLAIQEFLAQSLMVNGQEPERQRNIVVAPQRTPSVSQAQAMAAGVKSLVPGRWTEPMNLASAAKATPDPDANRVVPRSSAYPASLREQELPTAAFEEIQETQSTLDDFEPVLSQPPRVVTPFGNAIMREMSTEWRGDEAGAAVFRSSVRTYLDGLTKNVQLIQKSDATLSGRSATIPVTVQNNLVQGVKNLTLELTSSQPNRLDTGEPQEITVDGGHSQSFKFDTTANANGPVQVTAQLYTSEGKLYGRPMTFQVNVTEITSTIMLVIAGGVLLLVLAGVRIYLQRKRAARHGGEGPDGGESAGGTGGGEGSGGAGGEGADGGSGNSGGTDDGGTDGDGPVQPGDPGPDTGSGSTDPSGSGEKVDR
ncbi:hypothetical protein GKJPGBOP_04109 [Streptomyces paromomycinus]|uniref:Uncharacterized protein n=2 Tax=Streptomyces paromomycinus TaxID=92743 RepID=A0A401W516_STREY|nr:hypothetical protein GKJPGBOP_04109 [Streptomyces paromomycinus]